MDIKKRADASPPSTSRKMLFAQIIEMTGMEEEVVLELISLEWVSPASTADGHYLFEARDLYRLRKLSRLCNDLEITAAGGSIIVDLMERVEQLEARIEEMSKLI